MELSESEFARKLERGWNDSLSPGQQLLASQSAPRPLEIHV